MKTCTTCGTITDAAYCPEHQPKRRRRRPERYPSKSSTARGYDWAWTKTSQRARATQPWCTNCGCTSEDLGEPLQLDHSPEAWAWHDANPGKTIPLDLVTVLCGPCNRAAGAARGAGVTRPTQTSHKTVSEAATALGGGPDAPATLTHSSPVAKLPSHMRPILNKGA